MEKDGMMKVLKGQLQELMRNEIHLSTKISSDHEDSLSFFGGNPFLPADFQWPRYTLDDDLPLAFLGQLNLADIASHDTENLLPQQGILSFFYEMDNMEWGYSPEMRDCFRVFYFPETGLLAPAAFPQDLDEDYQLPRAPVSFTCRKSLPSWEEYADLVTEPLDPQVLVDGTDSIYNRVCQELLGYNRKDGNKCKFLGYADVIQDSMQMECQLVSAGFETGNGPVPLDEGQRQQMKEASKDWILLFQMDSLPEGFFPQNEEFELVFGDYGRLYFYIRREDLAVRRFDGCQLIMQC